MKSNVAKTTNISELITNFHNWQEERLGYIRYRMKPNKKEQNHHICVYTKSGCYIKNAVTYGSDREISDFIHKTMEV